MFLKRLKEKTHKKHIKSALIRRKITAPKTPLERIGVIVNEDESCSVDWHSELNSLFATGMPKVDVITFSVLKKKNVNAKPVIYSATHIGWNGTVKNEELKTFLDTNFSLLISYYTTDHTLLKLLTASSMADFKVGILKEDQNINDLIINTDLNAFATFKTELIKYLKILKRL